MDVSLQTIIEVSGIITVIGTAWLTVLKVSEKNEKGRDKAVKKIIDQAIENDDLVKAKLEAQISMVKTDLENFKFSVSKDLFHIKESQAQEIKNLGEKIENLRQELINQHSNLVSLLTKLVNKN